MRRNHWAKSFTRGETTHLQLSGSTEDTATQCGVYIHSVIFHYWWKKSSENGSDWLHVTVTFFFVLQHFALKPQQMYVQENQSSGRHDDVVFPNPVHTADSRVSVRAAAVHMWSGLSYSSVSLLRRSRTMSVFKQQQEVSAARWRSFSAWVEWFVSKAEKEERSEDIICKSTSGCRSCLMITMIFVFIIIKSSLQTGTSNSWLSGLYVPKCKQIKAPKNMKMKV